MSVTEMLTHTFSRSTHDNDTKVGEADYWDFLYDKKHLMVGQVYYSLKEMILFKVFEDVGYPHEIHVYELEHMREAFHETSGEKGAIFKNDGQKLKAKEKWENIQRSIGWSEEDYNDIKKFQYGYAENRLDIGELKEHLKYAEESTCFFKKDIKTLDRCITMLEKIEKL